LVLVSHPDLAVVYLVCGGSEVTAARGSQGGVILVSTILAVIVSWIALPSWSLADRARAQRFTARFTAIGRAIFLNRLRPVGSRKKSLTDKEISEFHWTKGLPPPAKEARRWTPARANDWVGWIIHLGEATEDV